VTDVSFVRQIAEYHRNRLLDRNKKVNDPTFSSGAAWAVHALDRVIAACNGEADPVALGLKQKPPSVDEQGVLFVAEVGETRSCTRCARKAHAHMLSDSGEGLKRQKLCQNCLRWAIDEGFIEQPERKYRTRDELLDEWLPLCQQGYTRDQAAERLGMKPTSFRRAHERARAAGDPRALLDHKQREWRALNK
jgi:hypothetical protein